MLPYVYDVSCVQVYEHAEEKKAKDFMRPSPKNKSAMQQLAKGTLGGQKETTPSHPTPGPKSAPSPRADVVVFQVQAERSELREVAQCAGQVLAAFLASVGGSLRSQDVSRQCGSPPLVGGTGS